MEVRELPRIDPPNVLLFAGTYALALASYGLLSTLPDTHDSLWVFVAALVFLVAYCAASGVLLRDGWWIPGGLAAALAVAMVPAVAVGLFRLVGVWDHAFPLTTFNGWAVAAAVVTALAGLVAFALTRFSFLLAIVAGSLIATSQLVAVAGHGASGDERATAALACGGLLVVVGIFLDAFGRRRDAFWFHALGWFSAGAGLVFFTLEPSGDPNRGWIPMLILGTLLVIVSGPIRRATWAVYGVLGYYAPIVHYLQQGLNENRWTFGLALLAVALSIFVTGMLQQRFGAAWGQRFVRRPPPGVALIL